MIRIDSGYVRVQELDDRLYIIEGQLENRVDSIASQIEKNQELLIEITNSQPLYLLEILIGLLVTIAGAILGAYVGMTLSTCKERREKRRAETKISETWDSLIGHSFRGRKKNPKENEVNIDIVEFKLSERHHDQIIFEGKNLRARGAVGPLRGSISVRPPNYEFGEGFYIHEDTDDRRRFGVIKVFLKDGIIVSQSEYVKPGDILGHEAYVWTVVN